MQIIIDIPNDHKRVIDNLVTYGKGYLLPNEVEDTLAKAVKAGTPLPDGHGRLIDADAFISKMEDASKRQRYKELLIDDLLTVDDVFKAIVESLQNEGLAEGDAPTIIEADDDSQYKWIPVSERLPGKAGKYLVTKKLFHNSIVISTSHFTTNLHDIAEYDFPLSDYKRCGWYEYDSEYGFYEEADIIAWMPLPEPFEPEEEDNDK